ALDVSLSAIMRGEAKPHRSFQIIVIDIEVAAIDTELAEVRRVRIGKVMQRMDAAAFLGATLSELEVQVRVFGVFVSDHSDHVALADVRARDHAFSYAVEVQIDDEKVVLSVDPEDDVGRAKSVVLIRLVGRSGTVHDAISDRMNGCADPSGQVNAVV